MREALAQHLANLIEMEGPIPVSTFMQLALSHPEHGYYRARAAIGAEGDFITAPEISQLFGEMIGIWVLQSWQDLGEPLNWHLVELGPGRGTLMSDIFRVLKLRQWSLDGVQLHLVETSEPLRAAQREALGPMAAGASWHSSIDSVPPGRTIYVANEFFDALPVRQFLKLKGVWCERRVALGKTAPDAPIFEFIAVPTLFDVESEIANARGAADGEISEFSGGARIIAAEIGQRLSATPGRAIIIDYGYFSERHGDTLQALRRHQKVGPFENIGEADLTAHVDFAALAHAAQNAGARSFGPASQGAFLCALGIKARLAALLQNAGGAQRQMLQRGFHRLTAPSEMGDLFRVLALSSPDLPPPPGFEAPQ